MDPYKVCGETVSPNAKTNPHCGEPHPVSMSMEDFVAWIVMFAIVLSVFWYLIQG
jgi:hypothetical protein